MSHAKPPRAVRNCNPGNIERTSIDWLGLMPFAQMDSGQRAEQCFCVFTSPTYGFRALALDLYNSWRKGRRTIAELVARFAPKSENNTPSYIAGVSHMTQIESDLPLNLADPIELMKVCKAVATIEAGGWDGNWRDDDLRDGVLMALRGTTATAVA